MRDLTKAQFEKALERNGFEKVIGGIQDKQHKVTFMTLGTSGVKRRSLLSYVIEQRKNYYERHNYELL